MVSAIILQLSHHTTLDRAYHNLCNQSWCGFRLYDRPGNGLATRAGKSNGQQIGRGCNVCDLPNSVIHEGAKR